MEELLLEGAALIILLGISLRALNIAERFVDVMERKDCRTCKERRDA